MFKKLTLSAVGLLLLVSPLVSSAQTTSAVQAQIDALLKQITQLQAQIATLKNQTSVSTTPTSSIGSCLNLTQTLTVGSSDSAWNGEVSRLQQFLAKEGVYPEGLLTGYFGQATSRAVQKWQSSHGIAITTAGVAVVGPKTRAAMAQNCAAIKNIDPSTPITIVSPKTGDVVVSGKQATVQLSFSKSFSEKVDGILASGNQYAGQPLSMGLLSERTGKIITLMPLTNQYMHSDVIDISEIRTGAFIYPFVPRTAVVGSEWNSGTNPTYLPPGRYRVVVYTRDAGSEGAIGKIQTSGDWFTVSSGAQSGVSLQVTQPLNGQSYSKGATVPLRWTLSGTDTAFVPRYFTASLVQATPENEQKGDTFTQTLCVLDSTGVSGTVAPQSQSLDWAIPTSATGIPANFREEFDTRYCSMSGVPSGKYRIDVRVNTCSGPACYGSNNSSPLGISDSSGVFEIK